MNARTRQKYEVWARLMKAMAHPTRLSIVSQLSKREHCVYELNETIGSALSTVSAHLSILKKAGIVVADKRGPQVFYSIKSPWALKFVRCAECIIPSNAQQLSATHKTKRSFLK